MLKNPAWCAHPRALVALVCMVMVPALPTGCASRDTDQASHEITGKPQGKDNPCICGWPGMRLLNMEIYKGDQLVLSTLFDAPDCRGPDYFWKRAGEPPFSSKEEANHIEPVKANPLRARIAGPVRIKIVHVGRIKTEASLTDLTLVRDKPDKALWYLPEKEVRRARKAAGLETS